MNGPVPESTGPDAGSPEPSDDSADADDARRRARLTPVGGVLVLVGLALVGLAGPSALRWLGIALAAAGVTAFALPRTRPSGTGDEDPLPIEDGRRGVVFAWSRFAPAMTVLTFVSAASAAAALVPMFARLGLLPVGLFFAALAVVVLTVVARFVPALRRRQVEVTDDGLVVVLRGRRAAMPWAAITRVDVARPAPQASAMGGAIVLRVADHEVPGTGRLQQRLRNLAAPYERADLALPVAGLRHDPGVLLTALEQRLGYQPPR